MAMVRFWRLMPRSLSGSAGRAPERPPGGATAATVVRAARYPCPGSRDGELPPPMRLRPTSRILAALALTASAAAARRGRRAGGRRRGPARARRTRLRRPRRDAHAARRTGAARLRRHRRGARGAPGLRALARPARRPRHRPADPDAATRAAPRRRAERAVGAAPATVALDYVRARVTSLGLSAGDLATLHDAAATRAATASRTCAGPRAIRGIPAYDNDLRVNVDRDGRVIDRARRAAPRPQRRLDDAGARRRRRRSPRRRGRRPAARVRARRADAGDDVRRRRPRAAGAVRRADRASWRGTSPTSPRPAAVYDAVVDASTGRILRRAEPRQVRRRRQRVQPLSRRDDAAGRRTRQNIEPYLAARRDDAERAQRARVRPTSTTTTVTDAPAEEVRANAVGGSDWLYPFTRDRLHLADPTPVLGHRAVLVGPHRGRQLDDNREQSRDAAVLVRQPTSTTTCSPTDRLRRRVGRVRRRRPAAAPAATPAPRCATATPTTGRARQRDRCSRCPTASRRG